MMKYLLMLFVLLMLISSVQSEELVYPAYKIPPESLFLIKKVKKTPPFLYFSGESTIRAKYIFNYISNEYGGYLELILKPTKDTIQNLPFLVQRGRDERPAKIFMSEAKNAAILLLSKPMASDLINGKYPSVTGEASMIISDFGAGYECDEAVFIAKVKSVKKLYQKAEIATSYKNNGC